jgi:hypothetical protein
MLPFGITDFSENFQPNHMNKQTLLSLACMFLKIRTLLYFSENSSISPSTLVKYKDKIYALKYNWKRVISKIKVTVIMTEIKPTRTKSRFGHQCKVSKEYSVSFYRRESSCWSRRLPGVKILVISSAHSSSHQSLPYSLLSPPPDHPKRHQASKESLLGHAPSFSQGQTYTR